MSQPIPIIVKRWRCPHCGRSRSKQTAATAHVQRCWWNPDNQTCKTCIHFSPGVPARECGTSDCNCPGEPPSCEAGVEFPEPDGSGLPITDCPSWKHVDDERDEPAILNNPPEAAA